MKIYRVEENICDCYPKTCCCDDWAIVDENGNKFSTTSCKKTAVETANSLNVPFLKKLKKRRKKLEKKLEIVNQKIDKIIGALV